MKLGGLVWQKSLVSHKASIQEVIRNLDTTGVQISLVVDEGNILVGTITDGDIRRALLRGQDLQSNIEIIMFQSPLVVPPNMGRDMVLHLMRANKVHQLPIVDEGRKVVGLHLWDDIVAPTSRPNLMVIMAGGLGKRLLPLTEDCPKPMLPVAGKPMLEHIINRAMHEGFSNFLISVHYLPHVIKEYFGNGSKLGVNISYIDEDRPLGTAGAIGLMSPFPNSSFIVTNGDVLTDVHYGEMLDFHELHSADATMAVRLHEWQHPFGVVRTDGIKIVGFEEKPIHRTHVNAGIYVLSPSIASSLDRGERCDMPALFERLQRDGRQTIAFPMHEPWLDVGRPEDLQKANKGTAEKANANKS